MFAYFRYKQTALYGAATECGEICSHTRTNMTLDNMYLHKHTQIHTYLYKVIKHFAKHAN